MLRLVKWEVKRSVSPQFLSLFLASVFLLLFLYLFYSPNFSQSRVLMGFYRVSVQGLPELEKYLREVPEIELVNEDADVYFTLQEGTIDVYIPGYAKSLLAYEYVKEIARRHAEEVLSSLPQNVSEPIRIRYVVLGESPRENLPPERLPSFRPIQNLLTPILLLLPSILMASLFGMSLMQDKHVMEHILLVPMRRWKFLSSKLLPYLLTAVLLQLFFSKLNLQLFLIVLLSDVPLFSLSLLLPLVSRSFKEFSMLSTFSFFSLFFLFVFPIVMYGYSELASLSPFSLMGEALLGKSVSPVDLLMAFFPFLWFSFSCVYLSSSFMESELIKSKRSALELLPKALRTHPVWVVGLIVPFVYFFEVICAIILTIVPIPPYPFLFVVALIEEVSKLLPFKKLNVKEAALVGVSFFLFEKLINLWLLFSLLDVLYVKVVSEFWMTLLAHVVCTITLFSFRRRPLALSLSTLIHFSFNLGVLYLA
ncbi:MAG TPA: hypothetical protein ENF51_01855 [Candidatus Aenigmarchaeota archaeon]|nr:hypothetical protein [Candidatus Aenigmarchaeota archaeon]